ncbi:MAG: hypothetical protein HUU01_17750 [Saprospiraceae bacterium]|nr:hypothetical protein [Saprospiraceae bacterium]
MQRHTMFFRLHFAAILLLFGFTAKSGAQSLSVTLENTYFICTGQVVQLFPLVSGGTGPYTYSWTPATNLSCSDCANPEVFVSQTTTYALTVMDAMGEEASAFTVVQVVPPMSAPVMSVQSPVCNQNGGVIVANPVGGTPPYTYLWSNGETTSAIGNLIAGIYCVTVVDNFGCSVEGCATITESSPMTVSGNVTNASCNSTPDGAISINVVGGTPPYLYLWNGSPVTEPVVNGLSVGEYAISVVDANGCTAIQNFYVGSNLVVDASGAGFLDCNTGTAQLQGFVTPSGPNINYLWTGPNSYASTQLNPVVDMAGLYTLIATNTNIPDCSSSFGLFVQSYDDIIIDDMRVTLTGCNTYQLSGIIPPDYFGPIQFEWTLPDGSIVPVGTITANQTGVYQLRTFIPGESCESYVSRFIDLEAQTCATLNGRVVNDLDLDCVAAAAEAGLGSWIITAASATDTFNAITDAFGAYSFSLPLGNYSISASGPASSWQVCLPVSGANLSAAGQVATVDIPVQAIVNCPELSVSLSSPLLRRCFNSVYYINVCNQGTETAFAPVVTLTLDAFLTYQSAQIQPSEVNGQVVVWTLTDLQPGECRSFAAFVSVSCDAELGQTHCSEVSVTPDPLCAPPSGNWSGASLALSGECTPEEVRFRVLNTGTGDLAEPVQYIVIEDAVMLMQNPGSIDQLPASEETIFAFPANGSTYIFSLEQASGHPFAQLSPTIAIEGCGENGQGGFSTGWVMQFPIVTTTSASDILCLANIGSYDPNDKSALPVGYGDNHYLEAGDEINYRIRFQNTGTDTAFTVVIRDELAPWLDITTLRRGNASHNYSLDIQGERMLVFTFDNILLPDSTTNQEGSNGFVDFYIRTQEDTPLETRVENTAAIYFDFNEPVLTNTVFHTIGENFIDIINWTDNPGADLGWKVYPNPTPGTAVLELSHAPAGTKILVITDQHGREIRRIAFDGTRLSLTEPLPSGWYALRLLDDGGMLMGSGKLVVK